MKVNDPPPEEIAYTLIGLIDKHGLKSSEVSDFKMKYHYILLLDEVLNALPEIPELFHLVS